MVDSAEGKPMDKCSVDDVRMVTACDKLNAYLQAPASKAQKSEEIYARISAWRYMSELDFKDMYFQMSFDKEDPKEKSKLAYLCIRTPYGTMAYSRGPQGLLGMDTYLEELTDRLFGDLMLEGHLIKKADNLYVGHATQEGHHKVFKEVLKRCYEADLRMKPEKVAINVVSADILGMRWERGTLCLCDHHRDPLTTCEPPKSIKALRSWIGGVNFNRICLPGAELSYAMEPLDKYIPSSKSGKELVVWSQELLTAFKAVQDILRRPNVITIPRPGDTVHLASDAAASLPAAGTKMFLSRPGVTGFLPSFNFGYRVTGPMLNWSSCELEAHAINRGLKYHEHFIRITGTPSVAYTDSKSSFQCKQKIDRGEVSASKRLMDLLVNMSHMNVTLQHISATTPSPILTLVDFGSRNPVPCTHENCSICKMASEEKMDRTIIGKVRVQNPAMIPVNTWKDIQSECADLSRAYQLVKSGKVLHKKITGKRDIRMYSKKCRIDKRGLMVVEKVLPCHNVPRQLIVVPRYFAKTLLQNLHENNDVHPTASQLKQQAERDYFILNVEEVAKAVTDDCVKPCNAMKVPPKKAVHLDTETKMESVGKHANYDVIEDWGQRIGVLCENLSSYTTAALLKDQKKETLRESIIQMALPLKIGEEIIVRSDSHQSLKGLVEDQLLKSLGIQIQKGHSKNKNSNAVVDNAIKEVRRQILTISPSGGPISPTTLARATEAVNMKIRHTGLSAKEIWTRRSQTTGEELSSKDKDISDLQFENRRRSCEATEKKRNEGVSVKKEEDDYEKGEVVFITNELSKSKVRDKHVILSVDKKAKKVITQKMLEKNPRKNLNVVKFENIYRARPKKESLEKKDPDKVKKDPDKIKKKVTFSEDAKKFDGRMKIHIDKKSQEEKTERRNNVQKEKVEDLEKKKEDTSKEKKKVVPLSDCWFCVKTMKRRTNHKPETCPFLTSLPTFKPIEPLKTPEIEHDDDDESITNEPPQNPEPEIENQVNDINADEISEPEDDYALVLSESEGTDQEDSSTYDADSERPTSPPERKTSPVPQSESENEEANEEEHPVPANQHDVQGQANIPKDMSQPEEEDVELPQQPPPSPTHTPPPSPNRASPQPPPQAEGQPQGDRLPPREGRVVEPGDTIRYLKDQSRLLWDVATIIKMDARVAVKFPNWYNMRIMTSKKKGRSPAKYKKREIELLLSQEGLSWWRVRAPSAPNNSSPDSA